MPPVVKRQQPNQLASKPSSILDRIREVRVKDSAVKIAVYGDAKSGKTRFACTFPKPLLLIGTEDGTASVATMKDVFFVRIHSTDELTELVGYLKDGKYKSAALDTAGGVQDIILKEELGLAHIPLQKSWGLTTREHWGVINGIMKEHLDRFLNLSDRYNINSIVIAHEKNYKEEGSDVIVKIGPALSPGSAKFLDGSVNYLCQMYKRQEYKTTTQTVDGDEIEMREPTGKTIFSMRVGPHSIYSTGFRVPVEVQLPDTIDYPKYEDIIALAKGEYKAATPKKK